MKTENCKLYHLAFSHFLGIGPIKFALLKKYFGSAKKAYLASRKELVETIGSGLTDKFLNFRNQFDPVKKLEELNRKEIFFSTVDDVEYPENLKNISDPPICIYFKGKRDSVTNFFHTRVSPEPHGSGPLESEKKFITSSSNLFFSIVGTRSPTVYGLQIAYKFSRELAESGIIIVSGLAKGIDVAAHRGALDVNGKTIAVLGCGVDIVYPAENYPVYQKIIEKNGLILSEFPPGQTVVKGLFIARNRIISALSSGVMIVEGSEDSGSLITARYAAEQGKEVFAPPSPITSKMSVAPNLLIKQGAKLVTSVEDIYEEFDIRIMPKKKEDIVDKLKQEEKEIFIFLNEEPQLIDELSLKLRKPINDILNLISELEIKGIIEKNKENRYQVKL